MTIQHRDIPDAQLHEPKGVSTASSGQVYTSDGAGSGSWQLPQLQGQDAANATFIPTSNGTGGVIWKSPETLEEESTSEVVLAAYSDLLVQNPSGLDVPKQVQFGPAQNATTDPVRIDALGKLIVNQRGTYDIKVALQYGRANNTGTSIMLFRAVLNGNQIGRTVMAHIDQNADVMPLNDFQRVTLLPGDELVYEIMRDSSGTDDGGLYGLNPALGSWDDSPSAYLAVTRIV